MLGATSLPVRFHAAENPLIGVSVPAGFIKCVATNKLGKTEVILMDGESMFIHESQLDAHELWLTAIKGITK